MTVATALRCERCGTELGPEQLACPNCGTLVHARQLNDIATAAQAEERLNPIRAAMIWREALAMLPPESQQYQWVAQRIGMLTAQLNGPRPAPTPFGNGAAIGAGPPRPAPKNDPLPLALFKTIGSMLISIAVYAMLFSGARGLSFGLQFATGFVLLMLVHELGHSLAMRHYRLSASPPIFIPFLGAVINLRQLPRNAWEEAVVGIGGPVLGTIGAFVTYLIYYQTGSDLFLRLAQFGFLLNLFNMLPVPPLDGGRVTAAVSPKVWITGLLAVVAWLVRDFLVFGRINPILILLLFMAWPRVQATLAGVGRNAPYYDIGSRAKRTMGLAYVVLGVTLWLMFQLCKAEAARRFGAGWME